jgi:hypothetical protein
MGETLNTCSPVSENTKGKFYLVLVVPLEIRALDTAQCILNVGCTILKESKATLFLVTEDLMINCTDENINIRKTNDILFINRPFY